MYVLGRSTKNCRWEFKSIILYPSLNPSYCTKVFVEPVFFSIQCNAFNLAMHFKYRRVHITMVWYLIFDKTYVALWQMIRQLQKLLTLSFLFYIERKFSLWDSRQVDIRVHIRCPPMRWVWSKNFVFVFIEVCLVFCIMQNASSFQNCFLSV